ncbi:hypothetical protein [Kitasatospora albolonga]|uniref:hypothetical protein n=1 Tax=Kitasatospora albolonga TaxID=68173 RepID=UPI0031EA1A97
MSSAAFTPYEQHRSTTARGARAAVSSRKTRWAWCGVRYSYGASARKYPRGSGPAYAAAKSALPGIA